MNSVSELSAVDMNFYICEDCVLPDRMNQSIENLLTGSIASDFQNSIE